MFKGQVCGFSNNLLLEIKRKNRCTDVEAVTFLCTLTFKSKDELPKHPMCDLSSVWDAETVRTKFQSSQNRNWPKEAKKKIFFFSCVWVQVCVSVYWCGVSSEMIGGLCPGGPTRVQVALSAICCATVLGQYLTTCSVLIHIHTHTKAHISLKGTDEISFSSAFH